MIIPNRGLEEKETEVTVVDENEVEGSDKENEQEEQTEPVSVVEQTDEWGGNL
jgi:nitrogen fixation protein